MPTKIFFSWQVDTPALGGRNLIERALERAADSISEDTSVEEAIREDVVVDRDTKGVGGFVPIVDTIFKKIDVASVFVPDLTFVGTRADGRPTPNPNVLIEYGWALKSIGYLRIVPIMNTAYGEPTGDTMPFDMRHLRHPITYFCPPDLDDASRSKVRQGLAKEIESALRLVFESEEYKAGLPAPELPPQFVGRQPVDGHGRFKPIGVPIGLAADGGLRGSVTEMFVSPHPASWFRMMPARDPGRTWSVDELAKAMQNPFLQPLSSGWQGYDFVRSHEGFGICSFFSDQRQQIRAVVFTFATGEVWSVDTYWLDAYKDADVRPTVPSDEASFRKALQHYASFLERLGVKPPFRWIAGMENLKGRLLYVPARPGYMRLGGPQGKCLEDVIVESGTYTPGDPPGPTLKPFFEKLYNACGVSRQDWQDN
jgi:hypothetical protein